MNKADKLKLAELAVKYGITAEEAELIVQTPYEFIRDTTKELDFVDGLSNDELEEMKTNFNLPAIGKLHMSKFLYQRIQENKKKKNLHRSSE